jgi:hypothetical protein
VTSPVHLAHTELPAPLSCSTFAKSPQRLQGCVMRLQELHS